MTPTPLTVWTDPSCPWAWQAFKWIRGLASAGIVDPDWRLFSLEINAVRETDSERPIDFWRACEQHGASFVSLRLASREGLPAFEALYASIGTRVHDGREAPGEALVRQAAEDAGMPGIVDRALAEPDLAVQIVREYDAARSSNVFGVPTLRIDGSKVAYGPLVARAPEGAEALELWEHVRWLIERPDFFELKRWPRDVRPGASAP